MHNHITVVGNLGRDPEMSYTPDGTAVTKFSVAVSRRWMDKSKNERKEHTDWFPVVAWRGLAETCSTYLHKGSKVLIAGRMESRKYTDKDGIERTAWEITASEMTMLDGAPQNGAKSSQDAQDVNTDDIPF